MIWLLLILLFPLVEITVFIDIGRTIGAGPVILLTIGTAIWGMAMVRVQGMDTFKRMQQTMARGETPAFEMIEGFLLLLAGFFLLLPGFITDAIGILLLITPLRKRLALKIFKTKTGAKGAWTVMGFQQQDNPREEKDTKKGRTIDQDDES